ncbi:LysM domain-containing protein [Heracleum sosnowskyi]|uniref:LysM domain-containing protein n=1 Tax=Heracleum sosnowskyi TaxID=360622 RepID=A0AAD8GXD2_9APIA|nr:LysM domain-containing protein [Heracleum sosnowskyi]
MRNFMPTYMASWILFALFLILLCMRSADSTANGQLAALNPFTCSSNSSNDPQTCRSLLYQSNDLQKEQIAVYYSVNASDILNITNGNKQDYLVPVPCSCKNVNGTIAYFYDTVYTVKEYDTFVNVSADYYSGQVWRVGGEEGSFIPGTKVPIHLLCGCVRYSAMIIVTYTVQQLDTLSEIADKLHSAVDLIQILNINLAHNSTYIEADWVLFVPLLY